MADTATTAAATSGTAKSRSANNRTLTCTADELERLKQGLRQADAASSLADLVNSVIHGDTFTALGVLPSNFADLVILDPPYNMSKNYNGSHFYEKHADDYTAWFERLILELKHCLRPTAALYVCAEWRTSILIAPVLARHFELCNRITWEREKGRGARANWKNASEDIWFCTVSNDYFFDTEAVKQKRRVIAPYKTQSGEPKGWEDGNDGRYRLTFPSNLWTDITVPFWSMPENTDHPTQKPEKLIAKLILASSRPDDIVLDPFLGSGTSAVVARKLGRRYIGIEQNLEYCCWSLKRLENAQENAVIQGYEDGVFWERNSGR